MMRPHKQCFLIDNDEDDREIFCMALQEAAPDFECITASSGIEAIESFSRDESFIPHCIFIDMNMPMMDGIECLQELKRLQHLQQVPVFMYSTSSDPKSVQRVNDLGAADFLVKPISYSGLVDMLTLLLQPHSTCPETDQ